MQIISKDDKVYEEYVITLKDQIEILKNYLKDMEEKNDLLKEKLNNNLLQPQKF